MRMLRKALLFASVPVVCVWMASALYAAMVIQCPQKDQALSQRWEWAHQAARNEGLKNGYWVGYSIERMMGPREFYISGTRMNFDNLRDSGRTSFLEMFEGRKEPAEPADSDRDKLKRTAKEALREMDQQQVPEKKTLKGLAVLFEFPKGGSTPGGIAILNLSLSTDLHNRPVIWLGKASDSESIALMQNLFATSSPEMQEELLGGLTAHQDPGDAAVFLENVLVRNPSERLRAEAASALGEIEADASVRALLIAFKSDQSKRVREEAVSALGEIRLPSARTALMEIAKNNSYGKLREEAVEIILDDASPSEISMLKDLMMNETDPDIQEAILYALADSKDAAPMLIQVARTHPDHDLREAALYALAEGGSDDAIATLKDVALKDASEDLQESALFALAELDDGRGIADLLEIARTHPNKEMRVIAVEALGDADTPEARDALRKLLQDTH